ncbi:MAG: NAD(P)H-dependent oxidoreductase [Bacteroidetes bacterium]|nr:NAD(P)H-dependent oxidoreductase [Bacteroidota bacterium]
MKKILAIVGSASNNSSNLKLAQLFANLSSDYFDVSIYNQLKTLPHFDPELSLQNPPDEVLDFRNRVAHSDGILISTPEYVFSIPSGLKNALEWCIASTVFTEKPLALITASASGEKAHAALQLVMKTAGAIFNESSTLLLPGIKGKFNIDGQLVDPTVQQQLETLAHDFNILISKK